MRASERAWCAVDAGVGLNMRWGEHAGESSGSRAPAALAGVGSAAKSAFWSFWLPWLWCAHAAPTELRLLALGRGILPKAQRICDEKGPHDKMGQVAVRSDRAPQILRPQRVRPRGLRARWQRAGAGRHGKLC